MSTMLPLPTESVDVGNGCHLHETGNDRTLYCGTEWVKPDQTLVHFTGGVFNEVAAEEFTCAADQARLVVVSSGLSICYSWASLAKLLGSMKSSDLIYTHDR